MASDGILTLENAAYVLSRYLQAFDRNPSLFKISVEYTTVPPPPPITNPQIFFHAILSLPTGVTCRSPDGPYPSKLMAKRAAAFSACRELQQRGELDEGYLPRPGGQAPKEKKAKLRDKDAAKLARWVDEGDRVLGEGDDLERGLSMTRRWEMFKGSIKERLPGVSPGVNGGPVGVGVYETIGDDWGKVGRRVWLTAMKMEGERAIGLLTAARVVDASEIFEVEAKVKGRIELEDRGKLKKLSEVQFDMAQRYTERAIRSILNKDVAPSEHWLVVPLIQSKRAIDWDEMTTSLGPLFSPMPSTYDDIMVASNPSEFGRKYYINSVTSLTPSSPHPDDPSKSILEYCHTPSVNPDQAVLLGQAATSGRSGGILSPSSPTYLIPELNQLYAFPASTYRSLSILPLFFLELNDYLAAFRLNSTIFENTLEPKLALQAITAPMAKPLCPDRTYERLEILGDTLIKLISTLNTCLRGIDDASRVERHVLVSNRSLRANGVKAGLPKYIRVTPANAKTWLPQAEKTVQIGDKIIADVVEALVGAAYLPERSLDAAITSMKRLHIPIDRISSWADIKPNSLDVTVEEEVEVVHAKKTGWMEAFTRPVGEQILGYTFRNVKAEVVFDVSLRSRQDVQQYKIVGDALLDYFVIEKLFDNPSSWSPAVITHMKHSRAADQALAAMTVCLGLSTRVEGDESIKKYTSQLQARKREVEFWAGMSYSSLGAIPEILLGAILSDGDIAAARQVFDKHYWPFMDKYGVGPIKHSLHPKSVMQERLGGWGCMDWEIVKIGTCADGCHIAVVRLHGQEIGRGTAETQSLATRAACEKVLDMTEEKLKALCKCWRREASG